MKEEMMNEKRFARTIKRALAWQWYGTAYAEVAV